MWKTYFGLAVFILTLLISYFFIKTEAKKNDLESKAIEAFKSDGDNIYIVQRMSSGLLDYVLYECYLSDKAPRIVFCSGSLIVELIYELHGADELGLSQYYSMDILTEDEREHFLSRLRRQ